MAKKKGYTHIVYDYTLEDLPALPRLKVHEEPYSSLIMESVTSWMETEPSTETTLGPSISLK